MPAKRDPLHGYVEQATLTIGTLASKTAVLQASPVTMTASGVIVAGKVYAVLDGVTAGDCGVLFGLMSDSYSQANLEEFLELNGPANPSADVNAAIAERGRGIIILGLLNPAPTPGNGVGHEFVLPKPLTFTDDSQGWDWWAYNLSGQAYAAGMTVEILANLTLRWRERR